MAALAACAHTTSAAHSTARYHVFRIAISPTFAHRARGAPKAPGRAPYCPLTPPAGSTHPLSAPSVEHGPGRCYPSGFTGTFFVCLFLFSGMSRRELSRDAVKSRRISNVPTYTYACSKCGHAFDVFHAMSAAPKVRCEKCKGTCKKQLGTGSGFIFKGSGFYETDFKDKKGTPEKKESGESKAAEAKPESKPEAKPAAKPEAKPADKQASKSAAKAKKPSKG